MVPVPPLAAVLATFLRVSGTRLSLFSIRRFRIGPILPQTFFASAGHALPIYDEPSFDVPIRTCTPSKILLQPLLLSISARYDIITMRTL
jgi:hypothetical protein